ncbi:hypothetical protein O5404_05190 (plasmid) [Borrelia miyamotoi]|nr:hypothetical protein [Borrelia miyamotoi]WAZ72419.1 hypothetical protein O5404_05190 [Borrelia miyamotoi]
MNICSFLDDLEFQFGNLMEMRQFYITLRLRLINVLNVTSVVIARDDHLNIIFVYSLLLLSICLDMFLVNVFR